MFSRSKLSDYLMNNGKQFHLMAALYKILFLKALTGPQLKQSYLIHSHLSGFVIAPISTKYYFLRKDIFLKSSLIHQTLASPSPLTSTP